MKKYQEEMIEKNRIELTKLEKELASKPKGLTDEELQQLENRINYLKEEIQNQEFNNKWTTPKGYAIWGILAGGLFLLISLIFILAFLI